MNVGMDIGTSTSSVCVGLGGEAHLIKCGTGSGATERYIPSAVYLKEDGTLLVGQVAEQNRMRSPQRFAKGFKRELGQKIPMRLGEKDYMPEELIARLIAHLKECAEKSEYASDKKIRDATICHPANFSQYKKDLLEKAAKAAGIDNVTLLDEPTAAAYYYHSKGKVKPGEKLLIYDLGGGTFDISLMERTQDGVRLLTRPLGIDKCGGEDFDYAVYQYLEQSEDVGLSQIKSGFTDENMLKMFISNVEDGCVKAKEQLSFDDKASIFLTFKNAEITRAEFEKLIKGYVDETIDKVNEALKNANLEPKDIDKILLVGGSCRIPYIKQRLIELVGNKVVEDVDPDLAVVQGALICSASNFTGKKLNSILSMAGNGDAKAQYELGVMYARGEEVTKDIYKSIELYKKSAEQGYAPAQCQIGVKYLKGEGVAQSNDAAFKWLEKAALQSYEVAEYNLGIMYEKGMGVTADERKAGFWYKKAAGHGYKTAIEKIKDSGYLQLGINIGRSEINVAVYENGDYITYKKYGSFIVFNSDGQISLENKPNGGKNPALNIYSIIKESTTKRVYEYNDKKYSGEQIITMALEAIKREMLKDTGARKVCAVIALPAHLNSYQRHIVCEACRKAGFVYRLIAKADAVCLEEYAVEENKNVLVINMDSSSLDVSVTDIDDGVFDVLSISGTDIGGQDFDNRIVKYLADEFRRQTNIDLTKDDMAMSRLSGAAEAAKIALSTSDSYYVSLPYITEDATGAKHLDINITRSILDSLTADLIKKCDGIIRKAINESEVKKIDEALLTGGSVNIPALRNAIKEITGDVKIQVSKGPIATGAARMARIISGDIEHVLLLQATTRDIYIKTDGDKLKNMIKRNSTIPTMKSIKVTTAKDYQTELKIHIVEGDSEDVSQDITITKCILNGLSPRQGEREIEVCVDIDASYQLHIEAKDIETNQKWKLPLWNV